MVKVSLTNEMLITLRNKYPTWMHEHLSKEFNTKVRITSSIKDFDNREGMSLEFLDGEAVLLFLLTYG